ncbi:hypothetical protein TorRG33x02_323980 [Trema orientale]|uniref:Uncharacterized protein n=1 Tax=Trema orientale TaxID=63057 RepID=A0A2P5BEE9_TREOI|nr:hypothetical protein TorRG33x02_323980 [Trema orientale]
MIRNIANVCYVQFFVHSTHLLALGLLITEPISMIYNILKHPGVSVIFVRLSVVDDYKASGSETNKVAASKTNASLEGESPHSSEFPGKKPSSSSANTSSPSPVDEQWLNAFKTALSSSIGTKTSNC